MPGCRRCHVPGSVYRGPIELIHTALDPKTRTVETHAEVANPGGRLRFGMAIRGTIQVGAQNRLAMRVPAEAVQDVEGKKVIYLAADEPNSYVAREVQIGQTVGGKTTILSGLKTGDRAVVKGGFMIKAQAMKAHRRPTGFGNSWPNAGGLLLVGKLKKQPLITCQTSIFSAILANLA